MQDFCEGLSHTVLHFLNRIIDCCCVAERANILLPQNLVVGGTALPSITFYRLSKLNPVSLYSTSKIDSFVSFGQKGSTRCLLSNTLLLQHLQTLTVVAFCQPDWISDLLPVIRIVFEQPIKTAPRADLSRVARFVKPCAIRSENSRYEIGMLKWTRRMRISIHRPPKLARNWIHMVASFRHFDRLFTVPYFPVRS